MFCEDNLEQKHDIRIFEVSMINEVSNKDIVITIDNGELKSNFKKKQKKRDWKNDDVILKIFSEFRIVDLLPFRLVNKEWKALVDRSLIKVRRVVSLSSKVILDGKFKATQLVEGTKIIIDKNRGCGVVPGIIYEGKFKDGIFIQGKMIEFYKKQIYEGKFKNGELIKGKKTLGFKMILEGEFKEKIIEGFKTNYVNGQGKIIDFYLNTLSVGKFENGLLTKGKVFQTSGRILEGKFKNGLFLQGKMTLSDGTLLEGEFMHEMLHGKGQIISPNGAKVEGYFNQGKLIQNTYCTII